MRGAIIRQLASMCLKTTARCNCDSQSHSRSSVQALPYACSLTCPCALAQGTHPISRWRSRRNVASPPAVAGSVRCTFWQARSLAGHGTVAYDLQRTLTRSWASPDNIRLYFNVNSLNNPFSMLVDPVSCVEPSSTLRARVHAHTPFSWPITIGSVELP